MSSPPGLVGQLKDDFLETTLQNSLGIIFKGLKCDIYDLSKIVAIATRFQSEFPTIKHPCSHLLSHPTFDTKRKEKERKRDLEKKGIEPERGRVVLLGIEV